MKGVTRLKRIEVSATRKMVKEDYHKILQYYAIPDGIRLIGKKFHFQEDNDPKHSSALCRGYLESKERAGKNI